MQNNDFSGILDEKIQYEIDSKVKNFATVTILEEDHTIGNVTRVQLLKDHRVRFSGYRKPHPLENKVEIKCQTTGEISPAEAIQFATNNTHLHVEQIKQSFQMALGAFKADRDRGQTAGNFGIDSYYGKTSGSGSNYSNPSTGYTYM